MQRRVIALGIAGVAMVSVAWLLDLDKSLARRSDQGSHSEGEGELRSNQMRFDIPIDKDAQVTAPRPNQIYAPLIVKQLTREDLPELSPVVPPTLAPEHQADLTFDVAGGSMRATPVANALPGEEIVVVFHRVINNGPNAAEQISASIEVPHGLEFDPNSPASAACSRVRSEHRAENQPQRIECLVGNGTLNPGDVTGSPIDVGLIVAPTALPGDLKILAELTAKQTDPDPDNNSANITIRVGEPPPIVPVVQVDGPAFDRPDSRADWRMRRAENHPYLGSINGDDGQPIDAFKVIDPETGAVRCAFAAAGTMVVGERRDALDSSCVTHVEYSETGLPVADNLNMPYVDWTREGEKDHPIKQRLLKVNGVKEGDGYTLSVAGNVLTKNTAGVSLQRDIRFPDGAQYITPHEEVRIVNRDGRLVLEVETGPNAWTFRDDKSGEFRITQTVDLGPTDNTVQMRVVRGNAVENDELFVRVGDAEGTPEQGPFPIARVAESGTGPVVHASLILPVGEDHGAFDYAFEREGDRNLTPSELHNLDWRLEDMLIDENNGKPWLDVTYSTVAGIDYVNMQANGHILYPEELANLLRHHGSNLLVDDHVPVGALNLFDHVATTPEEIARFAVESGGALKARITSGLDEQDWSRIYGSVTSDKIKSMSAVRQVFRERMERQVAVMNATREAGGELFFAMDFLHNIGYGDPFIYLPEVGGDQHTIGSFDKLLDYAQQIRDEVAAEKYPGLSFEGVPTSTTIPTKYDFDNKFMNPVHIAAILRDHPSITQIDLYQEFWFGEKHGRPVIVEGSVVRADEKATEALTKDLIRLATAIKEVNPNAVIGMKNIAGIIDGSDPKIVEIRKIYWLHFIKAAKATYEATGIRFNIELVNGTGEQTTWGAPISGPNYVWSEEPFGYRLDAAGEALFEEMRISQQSVFRNHTKRRKVVDGESANAVLPRR